MIYVEQLPDSVIYFKCNEALEKTQCSFANNGTLMAICCMQGMMLFQRKWKFKFKLLVGVVWHLTMWTVLKEENRLWYQMITAPPEYTIRCIEKQDA